MNYRAVIVTRTQEESDGVPETFRAVFHCWIGTSERPYALVEREDGRMTTVAVEHVTFDPPVYVYHAHCGVNGVRCAKGTAPRVLYQVLSERTHS